MSARAIPPFRLERLTAEHRVTRFTSGDDEIDAFLHSSALVEQSMGLSSATVALDPAASDAIAGFFTLSPLSIRIDRRLVSALGLSSVRYPSRYPSVGGYLLGRLGVDRHYQRRGIGQALVAVARAQARWVRTETGGVFLAVDARSDALLEWYERLGFSRLAPEARRMAMRL